MNNHNLPRVAAAIKSAVYFIYALFFMLSGIKLLSFSSKIYTKYQILDRVNFYSFLLLISCQFMYFFAWNLYEKEKKIGPSELSITLDKLRKEVRVFTILAGVIFGMVYFSKIKFRG